MLQVAPLQVRLRALALAGSGLAVGRARVSAPFTELGVLGTVATLTPLAALFLMVVKPAE